MPHEIEQLLQELEQEYGEQEPLSPDGEQLLLDLDRHNLFAARQRAWSSLIPWTRSIRGQLGRFSTHRALESAAIDTQPHPSTANALWLAEEPKWRVWGN